MVEVGEAASAERGMDLAARHGDDSGLHTVSPRIGRIHFRKDKALNINRIRTSTKGLA